MVQCNSLFTKLCLTPFSNVVDQSSELLLHQQFQSDILSILCHFFKKIRQVSSINSVAVLLVLWSHIVVKTCRPAPKYLSLSGEILRN
jgi:hypothetical protein